MIDGFHFAGIDDLDAKLLARVRPDVVLSGVFQTTFDVLDVATTLQALGYAGRYRAVADAFPSFALIVDEVRAIAPDIDFGFLPLTLS